MRVLAFTMGLALVAAPALANETQTTDTGADKDKVICKREQRTGALIARKVCATKAQWEQSARDTQMRLRGITGTVSNNGTAPIEAPILPTGR